MGRLGGEVGVLIPRSLLAAAEIAVGDMVDVTLGEGSIILRPLRSPARAGWAEASKMIAEAGDDAMIWPEFGQR